MKIVLFFIIGIFILCLNYPGVGLAQEQEWAGDREFIKMLQEKLLTLWQRATDLAVKLLASLGEIIEERKPSIKQELEKEREEMMEDLIKVKKLLWKKLLPKIKNLWRRGDSSLRPE